MQEIYLTWKLILIYLILGGILSFGYYFLLMKTLKWMKHFQRKGLYLFFSSIFRLALFILFSLVLTQCHAGRFLWYILGFMITRLFAIHKIQKVK